jgi:AmiR/NasT family two-component response regulator
MDSRAVIEQAKGVIMAGRRCSADDTFAMLTRISQDSNRKVRRWPRLWSPAFNGHRAPPR